MPEIDLEVQHGIPFRGELFGFEYWIVPMFHPALGLYDTGKMAYILKEWAGIKDWLADGVYRWATDNRDRDYRLAREKSDVDQYFRDYNTEQFIELIAIDTESHGDKPFSVQVSRRVGTGLMVLEEDRDAIRRLFKLIRDRVRDGAEIVVHNAPADLDTIQKHLSVFGVDRFEFRDTMAEAYHLNMPQGLKALSYRLLGRKRKSWDETVTPDSKRVLGEWIADAILFAQENLTEEIERFSEKTGKKLKSKIIKSEQEKVLTRILRHVDSDTYNPWEKLQGSEIYTGSFGAWPIKGVGNCRIEDVVEYGCLSKESLINTISGYETIGKLVTGKSRCEVQTYNLESDRFELRNISGWHKIGHKDRIRWLSVETDISRVGKWRTSGTRYTPDHRLLTPNGWVPIGELKPNDVIYYPGRKLSRVQKQIVLGSLLGDGTVSRRNSGGWAMLRISHCAKQIEYLKWKQDCLGNIVESSIAKENREEWVKIAGKWVHVGEYYRLSTIHHPEIMRYRIESYPIKGIKRVGSWIDDIGAIGLAVWYQDDGTLIKPRDGSARFYTNGFPKIDVEKIADVLYRKFGLRSTMFQMDRKWVMAIGTRHSQDFFEMISPFVHPTMGYKLPKKFRGRFCGIPEDMIGGLIEARVTKIYENPPSKFHRGSTKTAWCIDVAGTHNFCTGGEIAHNCSDADDTLAVELELEKIRGNRMGLVREEDWDV
jgi:hypothetical protein